MGKQNKGKKAEKVLGKGKVTPVQIAFIVDRYLTDNNYTSTLSAFRSEAHDLLSKTKGKEAPKGLLGLAEIFNEYICLKEQRVMVDQEKQRVETALRGIQEVMRTYQSACGGMLPSPSPPLLPPQLVGTNSSKSSPPSGHTIHGTALMNYAQPPMLPLKAVEPNNISTPLLMPSYANKRKSAKSAPKVPPTPKKSRTQPPIGSSMTKGKTSSSQVTCIINTEQNKENLSALHSTSVDNLKSSIQGSSVAKSLFNQPPENRANSSSPKTPPQAFPSQADNSGSPPEDSSLHTTTSTTAAAATSREITSRNCSITSSETIVVSPLKRAGYYSIERSYHVTSSPFKSSPKKLGKREHVKGRLQFDEPGLPLSSEEPVATSSTDMDMTDTFDFDLPDFDIFNGDFLFSDLLADIDLSCEGIPSTDSIQGSEHNTDSRCFWEANQALPDSCMSTIARGDLSEDMNIQGHDSVTSVRSITKCINIFSPSKARSNCPLEQANSPAKA